MVLFVGLGRLLLEVEERVFGSVVDWLFVDNYCVGFDGYCCWIL